MLHINPFYTFGSSLQHSRTISRENFSASKIYFTPFVFRSDVKIAATFERSVWHKIHIFGDIFYLLWAGKRHFVSQILGLIQKYVPQGLLRHGVPRKPGQILLSLWRDSVLSYGPVAKTTAYEMQRRKDDTFSSYQSKCSPLFYQMA